MTSTSFRDDVPRGGTSRSGRSRRRHPAAFVVVATMVLAAFAVSCVAPPDAPPRGADSYTTSDPPVVAGRSSTVTLSRILKSARIVAGVAVQAM